METGHPGGLWNSLCC